MGISAQFGFQSAYTRPADCTVAEEVGDFVYISGDRVAGEDQVRKAIPSNDAKVPAIGVIISKPTTTTCVVQWDGETPSIFSGLTTGKTCYLGSNSKVATKPPTSLTGMITQIVGVAVDNDTLYLDMDSTLVKTYEPAP